MKEEEPQLPGLIVTCNICGATIYEGENTNPSQSAATDYASFHFDISHPKESEVQIKINEEVPSAA